MLVSWQILVCSMNSKFYMFIFGVMNTSAYIQEVSRKIKQGHTSEHSFREDLSLLIKEIASVDVLNEPSKITDCGSPDYVVFKNTHKYH